MLTMLLLDANRVIPIDQLAEALYGEARPASAVTQIHGHVSQLRKLLGPGGSLVETRAPGYVLRATDDQVDLRRFERLTRAAADARARGEHETAASLLADALALWRGPALADLAEEPFADSVSARLEDLRLAALEQQVDASLALGREAEALSTLEAVIPAQPYRERFRAQLMLALYRLGRQAEALEAYQAARRALVEEFGIEPTPALHRLQQAILTQDAALERQAPAAAATRAARTAVLAPSDDARIGSLLPIAELLARDAERELVVTRLVARENDVRTAAKAVNAVRATSSATTRAAVFTSSDPASDLVRFAMSQDAELVIVDAAAGLEDDGSLLPSLAFLFEHSPVDVAVVTGTTGLAAGDGIYVPFGGGEHDWAALELAALFGNGAGLPLRLIGASGDSARGRPDASRALAAASLAVERVIGVETEPLLADPEGDALVDAAGGAALIVLGCSTRWRQAGVGASRSALLRSPRTPVVVVHRGPRPGALAPPESATRFTWTIER